MSNKDFSKQNIILILVASLGFFVDVYDIIIFNIVKYNSLKDLGFSAEVIKKVEIDILNWQMFGMLLGGILWGVMGDRIGRTKALFGSILMYSLANVANAFVTNIPMYSAVRFIAGFGLAGELGAGITLVVEFMSKERRGIGTTIVVFFGALGALATRVADDFVGWKGAYILGGVMGLMLLVLRYRIYDSSIYQNIKDKKNIVKGNFFNLFANRRVFFKYVSCIFLGLPIWYVIGILMVLGNRFASANGITNLDVAQNIVIGYIGLCVGDVLAGILSQILKSRKKVILLFVATNFILIYIFLFNTYGVSHSYYFWLSFVLGIFSGYWALFVTVAAEQFGTNIRSTVANTVPNFVRGSVPIITISFVSLSGVVSNTYSAFIVGCAVIALSLISLFNLRETFGKELNYVEKFSS